jgi:hypothetical protein
MTELLALGDSARTVENVEFRAETAAVASPGMSRPTSRTPFRKMPP